MPEHLKINCGAGGELHKVTPLAFNQMHSYWKLTMMMAMLMLWTTKNFSFSRPAGGPALHLIIQDTDRNMNPLQCCIIFPSENCSQYFTWAQGYPGQSSAFFLFKDILQNITFLHRYSFLFTVCNILNDSRISW